MTRTSDAINQQARTLRVEVDIPNAQQTLVPGMYVEVGFGLQPKGLVQVPAAALIFRSGARRSRASTKPGKSASATSRSPATTATSVELGSGVEPGDELAFNVSSQISDGELVTAHRTDSAAPGAAPQSKSTREPAPNDAPATARR